MIVRRKADVRAGVEHAQGERLRDPLEARGAGRLASTTSPGRSRSRTSATASSTLPTSVPLDSRARPFPTATTSRPRSAAAAPTARWYAGASGPSSAISPRTASGRRSPARTRRYRSAATIETGFAFQASLMSSPPPTLALLPAPAREGRSRALPRPRAGAAARARGTRAQRGQRVPRLVLGCERHLQRHALAGDVGHEARRRELDQPDVAAVAEADGRHVGAQVGVEQRLGGRDDRGAAGRERTEQLRLRASDVLDRPQELEVDGRDTRDHADPRPRNRGERGDLAGAAHPQLRDEHLRVLLQSEERERQADLVVVPVLGRDGARDGAAQRGEDVLPSRSCRRSP